MSSEAHNNSRYINGRCRCDVCREAHRVHVSAWRATRRETARLALITYADIAKKLGISEQRVRALEKSAITKLQRNAAEFELDSTDHIHEADGYTVPDWGAWD